MRATAKRLAPVTLDAFKQIISPICREAVQSKYGSAISRPTIALAVSGGVDSMALALLCSKYQRQHPDACTFHAYVVDHKARSESTLEARTVVENVSRLGLQINTLELQWPPHEDGKQPLELPNFEGLAREMRYDALGREIARQRHGALLTAHHSDDQAETVLMRLVSGYTGLGLQAIRHSTPVPCNVGRYYVHHGCMPPQPLTCSPAPGLTETVNVAGRGLLLHRPLLSFSKQDLIDTCTEAGVAWVEDSTNLDPTATLRNALRYLLNADVLPHALRKPALLRTSARVADLYRSVEQEAVDDLKFIRFESLDLTVGGANVVLKPSMSLSQRLKKSKSSLDTPSRIVAFQRILQTLSPLHDVDLKSSESVYHKMILNTQPEGFTQSGLHFQRNKGEKANTRGWLNSWKVSRQPRSRSATSDLKYLEPLYICPIDGSFSDWQLVDGRWWLRVAADAPETVVATQLRQQDMADLDTSFATLAEAAEVRATLKRKASGHVRFTIPALASTSDGNSTLLALPTLGVVTRSGTARGLRFECQWKHIDALPLITPRP